MTTTQAEVAYLCGSYMWNKTEVKQFYFSFISDARTCETKTEIKHRNSFWAVSELSQANYHIDFHVEKYSWGKLVSANHVASPGRVISSNDCENSCSSHSSSSFAFSSDMLILSDTTSLVYCYHSFVAFHCKWVCAFVTVPNKYDRTLVALKNTPTVVC